MVRPREFDRDTALQKAMQLFWAKGYEGTSMSDLTEAMAISRSSLYETFGDKQDLFLEALNNYFKYTDRKKTILFAKAVSIKQGMAEFLSATINFLLDENLPGGCFFTNTATALGTLDKPVQTVIRSGFEKQEEFFFTLFERAKKNGEFNQDKDPRALARFFVGLIRGMTVIARVDKNREMLEDIVKVGLTVLN